MKEMLYKMLVAAAEAGGEVMALRFGTPTYLGLARAFNIHDPSHKPRVSYVTPEVDFKALCEPVTPTAKFYRTVLVCVGKSFILNTPFGTVIIEEEQ